MTRILIVGAGGHAQVIADLILSLARVGEDVALVGFVDDDPQLFGCEYLGAKVWGATANTKNIQHDALIIGIGDNAVRARLYQHFRSAGEKLINLIHPRATLATDVQVEAGTVVFAGAVINTGSIVGSNVIVNTGATVDHHARIGAHCHIAPGVHLGGAVTLGEGVFLGIGSNVVPNRSIGEWTIVGAGAVIIHDLPSRVTAVGIPAHIIKSHDHQSDQATT